MRKVLLAMITLVLVLTAIGGGVTYLSNRALNRQEVKDFQLAQSLIEKEQPHKALLIIQDYTDAMTMKEPEELDWLILAGDAFVSMGDSSSLTMLYEKYPRITEKKEEIAFLIARGLLAQRRLDHYRTLRNTWYPVSDQQHIWFVLDVDALLVEGRRKEARDMLESQQFNESKDTGRLIRLALLEGKDNLKGAWEYLTEALKKDPNNTEISSYRAHILEAIQKPALARMEYLRSIQKDPDNPTMYDQLAEFYRRHGLYSQALETWKASLNLPHSDQEWLKMVFWSRMAYPIEIDPALEPSSENELSPLVNYIRALPEDTFWNEELFEEVPSYPKFLRTRQETFWLRLAQALKNNDEDKATELLDFNVFHRNTWNPPLQKALKQILSYRNHGILHIDEMTSHEAAVAEGQDTERDPEAGKQHQFFEELQQTAFASPVGVPSRNIPPALQELLESDYVFPSVFLAAGWLEAALSFPLPAVLPKELPDWVAFAYTQALRFNRSPLEALNFATKQKKTPALDLLIGELMVATGSPDAGMDYLQPLAKENTDLGMRAAWVISMLQLQDKQFNEARETVQSHPGLVKNIVGKEALARIALQQGDIVRADQLYNQISDDSLEAKLYLARRAYANKEYDKALALTEQLILYFPENPDLRKDLEKLRQLVQSKESP